MTTMGKKNENGFESIGQITEVVKRDGSTAPFDSLKIKNAMSKAFMATNEVIQDEQLDYLTCMVLNDLKSLMKENEDEVNHQLCIEDIQDTVQHMLMKEGFYKVADNYITYRYKRMLARKANTTDDSILKLIGGTNEELAGENANKNPVVNSTQRDYMAGEVSKDLTNRILLPEDIVQAHKQGIIHFHDADYFAQRMHNCDLVNLDDMLQNGTVISGTMIEKPHSFATACNIATQIVAQVASNQYGGQSISLAHLAPFVDISRQKIRKKHEELLKKIFPEDQWYSEKFNTTLDEATEDSVRTEVRNGVQTIQYQVLTLLTTNGQTPFITVLLYLGEARNEQEKKDLALIEEEVLIQRYKGVKNENGEYITPAFPKLIFIVDEDTATPDAPYYYLTKLSAKCSAKRMVPDYISEKKMLELKGDVYPCMGCRAFLTPDRFTDAGIGNIANAKNYDGKHKYYGRFNQGVVTINLPDVALSSGGNIDEFWKIFDERLDLCHRALRCRHERLLGTPSDVAPILWQHGALARLEKGETIDKLLFNGYSTISLGYAGLYECVKYMTGKSHTDPDVTPFAIKIMERLNEACSKWKAEENIDYSIYGTPLESTTYKFAKCLKDRFGVIKDITDHSYITNSYHINVREKIDAFSKLSFESQFQALSPGGAISYVEVPNMEDNIEAVLQLISYIYDHIIYAELNTKSDYCQCCGYSGEIKIIEDENGKLVWECPKCGNRDQSKMNVARRTCGYIGTQFWNQGRTEEIRDRVLHL